MYHIGKAFFILALIGLVAIIILPIPSIWLLVPLALALAGLITLLIGLAVSKRNFDKKHPPLS